MSDGRSLPRCRGRVDVGLGMTDRCILRYRHRGPCRVEPPDPIDHAAEIGRTVGGRQTCAVCDHVINVSVTHVWPPEKPG